MTKGGRINAAKNVCAVLVALAIMSSVVELIEGCTKMQVISHLLGDMTFESVPLDNKLGIDAFSNGRAVYIATDSTRGDKPTFLYHKLVDETEGLARWVVNDVYDSADSALAYINSWAVAPHLINSLHERRVEWWMTDYDKNWMVDDTFSVRCLVEDTTFYFEVSSSQPFTGGFYIERVLTPENTIQSPVFTKVVAAADDPKLYMYRNSNVWMIGVDYHVDSCYAYVDDKAPVPTKIANVDWRFISSADGDNFVIDNNEIIHKGMSSSDNETSTGFQSAYHALRFYRSIKFVPAGQKYLSLRNNVPIPQIGLGTGGIDFDNTVNVVGDALLAGYRLLDLAQEYKNEELIPEVFARLHEDPDSRIFRNDVFLQSKVWPTHLGFKVTYDTILQSLTSLGTTFIDSYLIHWPFCDEAVEWMHCEEKIDPDGTWQGSWNALQRAYSEGIVNSIGVSNFDKALLEELDSHPDTAILPHIVQNFADLTNIDLDVRNWCKELMAAYQPYASGRNIASLPDTTKAVVDTIAQSYPNQTPYSVALKFFEQTGAVVIPRSNKKEHLESNLKTAAWALSPEHMEMLGWPRETAAAEL